MQPAKGDILNTKFEINEELAATIYQVEEVIYPNGQITAGLAKGIEPDTIYIRLQRNTDEDTTIFLRPDEALAITHCLSAALLEENITLLDSVNTGESNDYYA